MRSNNDPSSQSIRHEKKIDLLNEEKDRLTQQALDFLPPPPPVLLRACAAYPGQENVIPTVYLTKEGGDIIADRGEHIGIEQNPKLLKLGTEPLSDMPVNSYQGRQAFKKEISEAVEFSQANQTFFFRRPVIRKTLTESTPLSGDLSKIIIKYV